MQYGARKWGEFHGFNLIDMSDSILPASSGGNLARVVRLNSIPQYDGFYLDNLVCFAIMIAAKVI
jgi:hypothetical protein